MSITIMRVLYAAADLMADPEPGGSTTEYERGIITLTSDLLGLPEESRDDVESTLRVVKSIRPHTEGA